MRIPFVLLSLYRPNRVPRTRMFEGSTLMLDSRLTEFSLTTVVIHTLCKPQTTVVIWPQDPTLTLSKMNTQITTLQHLLPTARHNSRLVGIACRNSTARSVRLISALSHPCLNNCQIANRFLPSKMTSVLSTTMLTRFLTYTHAL